MRIRDPDLVQKILKTIVPARGDESQVPVDLDETVVQAVLDLGRFLPTAEQTGVAGAAGGISDQPGAISASELWANASTETSGVGGAGQFSGVVFGIQSIGAGEAVAKLQLAALKFIPTVDAELRLFYVTTDFSQAEVDLNNLETNEQSVTTPSASNFGGVPFVIQTPTPGSLNPGGWSAMASRVVAHIGANALFEFPLGPVALYNRTLAAQSEAMGFAVFARATVTAITVTYSMVVRKLPA